MNTVGGVEDLINGIGKILSFPEGINMTYDPPEVTESLTGLLLESPSLRWVSDPTLVIPSKATIWADVSWTPRAWRMTLASTPHTRLQKILTAFDNLFNVLEIENHESFYRGSARISRTAANETAKRLERARVYALESIRENDIQPCRVLFSDKTRWVWIHPSDVKFI